MKKMFGGRGEEANHREGHRREKAKEGKFPKKII